MKVVDFARDILAMQDRIDWLEFEVARLSEYERKYHEAVHDSIAHNQQMLGGLFQLGMKLAAEKDAAS